MKPTRPHVSPASDSRIGTTLVDRYRIERKLGEGGMGVVYGGEHVLIGRPVAIKLLHRELASDPVIVGRFQREAQAVNAIGHPNIVEVTDMGNAEDGTPFLVMELLLGETLESKLDREGLLSPKDALGVALPICDALGAAHAHGFVHRDLKPENVFLTDRSGQRGLKVLDFGIAKMLEGAGPKTRTGSALGTPHFMSPEQAQGSEDVDARTDIYALGVLLFQMLTGTLPFGEEEGFVSLLLRIATEPAPSLSTRGVDLPASLVDLVDLMLQVDKEHRPASVTVVRSALVSMLEGASTAVASGPLAGHPSQRPGPNAATRPIGQGAVLSVSQPPTLELDYPADAAPMHAVASVPEPLREPAPPPRLELDESIEVPSGATARAPTMSQLGGRTMELEDTAGMPPLELDLPRRPIQKGGSQRASRRLGWVMGIVAVGAVLLSGLGIAAWATSALMGEPEAVAVPTGAAPPVPPSPGAGLFNVRVRIETTPADAQLFLDGTPVQNPYEVTVPSDDVIHRIRVVKPGYVTETRELDFQMPRELSVDLRPD